MKNTKKNSVMKKILPSACMLAVSAAMLSTSTYAWFTMNKEVAVKSMKVKAKAEEGLLINEVSTANDPNWDDEATANSLPGTALVPTSTKDTLKWWHANSKTVSDEAGADSNAIDSHITNDGYTQLALTAANTAAVAGSNAENDVYSDTDGNSYYVKYKYYIKSSAENGITLGTAVDARNLAIKEISVTEEDGDSDSTNARSTDLNKALRVGVVINNKMYIYAPCYGEKPSSGTDTDAVATYYVTDTYTAASLTNTAVNAFKKNEVVYTDLASIAGSQGAGTEVDVYLWFEGEDDNCQADKITPSLDDITVDITFGLEKLTATRPTYTNNAFTTVSGG